MMSKNKNSKQRKKSSSRKKKRDTAASSSDRGLNSYSKFRNTFLSMYDYTSPTPSRISCNAKSNKLINHPQPITTSATLKKMFKNNKKEYKDVNTVIINSCNDKPLMIKVNSESNKGLVHYNSNNHYMPLNQKHSTNQLPTQDYMAHFKNKQHLTKDPEITEGLQEIKQRFVSVLDGYKHREKMLIEK